MAKEKIIFHRPANDAEFTGLDNQAKDILSFSVLFGCSKYTALERLSPEDTDKYGKLTKAGREAADQLWSLAESKLYIKSLKETLANLTQGIYSDEPDAVAEISEDTKKRTITKMLNNLVKLVGKGDLTGDDLKIFSEIMKKVGWLKDDEEQTEVPRRYLPVRCRTECAYRLFVESNVESGKLINDCDYCRTRKFAEENGWHYDSTKNLDLPEDIINPKRQ